MWCQGSACPLLVSFAGTGLVARGQPIALASASVKPPRFTWAAAAKTDAFSLKVSAWPYGNKSAVAVIWSLEGVPGSAVSDDASAANGTEHVPWQLDQVSRKWAGADMWVDLSLSREDLVTHQRAVPVQRTSFQTRSCRGSLHVKYGEQESCACGRFLSPAVSAVPPSLVTLTLPPTAPATVAAASKTSQQYVLLLLDRDALSWQHPSLSPLLHAAYADVDAHRLANGVDLRNERVLLPYMGPAGLGPGSYSAPHRYSWRAYAQPAQGAIPAFPRSFDRTSFALDAWLAANGLPATPDADDLFRSEAALPDHVTCDGVLGLEFEGGVKASCTAELSAAAVARAPTMAFAYPYFEDVLQYALVAVEPASETLLWMVLNIQGALINAGTRLPAPNATEPMPYEAPAAGGSALFLLYVQPGPLDGDDAKPLGSREGFDAAAWAASVGIARPSASNAVKVGRSSSSPAE